MYAHPFLLNEENVNVPYIIAEKTPLFVGLAANQ